MGRISTKPLVGATARYVGKKGCYREFLFPPLPAQFTRPEKLALCRRWADRELAARGMQCEVTLEGNGQVVFSCSARRFGPGGSSEVVEEWGTPEFFEGLKASFITSVNRELALTGLPRDFTFA